MKYQSTFLNKVFRLKADDLLYISIVIILCLVIVSGIFYYLLGKDLQNYIHGITLCPFHAITGKPCPGCGMSRAFLLLGQFKIIEALRYNIFSLPLLLLMIIYIMLGRIPIWMQNKYLIRISLLIIMIYWILRILSSYNVFHQSFFQLCL